MIERPKLTRGKIFKLHKCTYCGALGHSSFGCRKKPRKPLVAKSSFKKMGKLAKAYALLRETFLEENPGPYYCVYCLHVGIEKPLNVKAVHVEHYHSKARHPELRFKKENLVVSCAAHNKAKGSLDGSEYLRILERGISGSDRA